MAAFQTPKGTYDILPDDWPYWRLVIETVEAMARRYGYRRIDTPMFEATELFDRGAGPSSDVVTKEMYTFEDKGGRSLTLRPEPTAPVVRAYIQHGMHKLPQPVRLYYVAVPMFRYDEVQEGRYRQFHQFGVEALGEQSAAIDVEVISLLRDVYLALGLRDLTLAINSTGCPLCRPAYVERLVAYYRDHYDTICEDDHRRLQLNPLRVLDCKKPQCQPIANGAPHILDYLGPECRTHWDELLHLLAVQEIAYTINHRLVRGLDYYTKTCFEFWPQREGAQSTVGGGGRYDGLAELLGGPPTPGIGFGSGVERVILNLRDQGIQQPSESRPLAYVAYLGDEVRDEAFRLLARLRAAGIGAGATATPRKLGDQLRRAEGMAARYAVIVGPDELAAGQVGVRDLAARTQEPVPLDAVVQWLQERAISRQPSVISTKLMADR